MLKFIKLFRICLELLQKTDYTFLDLDISGVIIDDARGLQDAPSNDTCYTKVLAAVKQRLESTVAPAMTLLVTGCLAEGDLQQIDESLDKKRKSASSGPCVSTGL